MLRIPIRVNLRVSLYALYVYILYSSICITQSRDNNRYNVLQQLISRVSKAIRRTQTHATQAQAVCVEVKTVHSCVVPDTNHQMRFNRGNFWLIVRPTHRTTLDLIYLKRRVRNVIVGITLTVQAQMLAHLARKIHLQAFRVELNVSSALPVRSVRIISHCMLSLICVVLMGIVSV